MVSMFEHFGYYNLVEFTLPDEFNTSKVTNMNNMFKDCGYTALHTLTLPTTFCTDSVTTIDAAFYNTGHTSMKTLTLGSAFHNINIASDRVPESIFYYTGGSKIEIYMFRSSKDLYYIISILF